MMEALEGHDDVKEVYANAEFLCSTKLSAAEKEDLFQEIQNATNDMTELIDSMIELSRKPGTLMALSRPTAR